MRKKLKAKPGNLAAEIRRQANSPQFRRYLSKLLLGLCRIDTTPNQDVSVMRDSEARCFDLLERELRALRFSSAHTERRAINPEISQHPAYSQLHFTKTARRPTGLSPEETYAGRANLLYFIPGLRQGSGQSVALNAHVDVVAPYFPPCLKGARIFGRGSCDDKGAVVAIVGALRVLSEIMAQAGLRWNRNVLAMFVVEEETGGNGSLSLALDRQLKDWYDSILVGEATNLRLHPANRGAVWYAANLQVAGVPLLELAAFIIEELEKEGAMIRAESRHDLFPQRPVQTCHGIIGGFGQHPSRICGEVRFEIQFDHAPGLKAENAIEDLLESALAEYTALYGDKTKVTDPATGMPMVARHYECRRRGATLSVSVHGATGHMGSVRERDGAITKMGHLVRWLGRSRARIERLAGGKMRLRLAGSSSETLALEGGQGFVPTHDITEIMDRFRAAAARGADNYLRLIGRTERGQDVVRVTYEKLHNAAFEGDPKSKSMRNAIAAAKQCGIWQGEPIRGWTVSCDARLFATEYPGMDVLTFGPGLLAHAHSDQEQLAIPELCKAVEFLALFLLRQTGSLP
jgi:acetylornithine deacetylase/succinyl-diaminopimelate desuccinylase-like protein